VLQADLPPLLPPAVVEHMERGAGNMLYLSLIENMPFGVFIWRVTNKA
jgi:hypothetical protein